MATSIFCKRMIDRQLGFYVQCDNKQYYLFSQRWRRGVTNYYRDNVVLHMALDKSRAHNDRALCFTMDKLPVYLRYIEQQYGIVIFDKKNDKANGKRRIASSNYYAMDDYYEVA